jgi:hypothetical protein
MGGSGPGLLFAVWGAGGLLATAASLWLVRRRGYGLALAVGSVVFAVSLGVCGAGGVALAVIAIVPAGLGFALVENAVMALVPRLADDAIIGRVYALSELLYAGAAGVGALVAPALIGALGVGGSLAAVGAAYGVAALCAWRSYARIDAGQERAGRIRELLRGVPFLAPLPLPRLERLVRGARERSAPAGTDIIRAGEPGEEFFVIESGTVLVLEYGRHQGPGTGFGEIALLRDVSRTATVRADTDVRLWSLRRSAFLAAITGHGEATRIADTEIDERLVRPPVGIE